MTVHKVLIPIDRSAFSLTILPTIEHFLAPQHNALIFLHVAEAPLHERGMDANAVAAQRERLKNALYTEVALELQPLTDPLRAKGYAVALEVLFGEPIPEIERFALQQHIDLVAMTTHSRSGLGRVLLGSIAQHLLQHLTVPILLFHPPGETSKVVQGTAEDAHS